MITLSNHQNDLTWWDSRMGRVTGSMTAAVLSTLKRGGESQKRMNYKLKLVTETLYGAPVMDGYLSAAMQFGTENEDLARAAYEMKTGADVTQSGFVLHDEINRWGGSPDGYVGKDGLIEIKVPDSTTHIDWMLADVIPEDHEPQMMAYLAITGRAWCDFVGFDPRAPERLQLFTKRLLRDEARIQEIESGVIQFLAEVDEMVDRLKGAYPEMAKLRTQLEQSLEAEMMDTDVASWYASHGLTQKT